MSLYSKHAHRPNETACEHLGRCRIESGRTRILERREVMPVHGGNGVTGPARCHMDEVLGPEHRHPIDDLAEPHRGRARRPDLVQDAQVTLRRPDAVEGLVRDEIGPCRLRRATGPDDVGDRADQRRRGRPGSPVDPHLARPGVCRCRHQRKGQRDENQGCEPALHRTDALRRDRDRTAGGAVGSKRYENPRVV
jgi:hypothetical protein